MGESEQPAGTQTVFTFCRYCLASCGVEVTLDDNRVRKISADKQNPHSWQDFCAKGRNAAQLVDHPRRILAPMRRVGETYVEATWDEAISDIAARMTALIDADGPDAIGAYYGNPAGYSSSNLIFMNGWLDAVGTQNRYAVGSVDQNALHYVAEAMYGSSIMVPVSDIDRCDYFLLVGANPAVSAWNWVESAAGGWKRALARQKQGATIVVVDPLRTESADRADIHIAVRPGQDWALLLGMVKVIVDEGLEHREDCAQRVTGMPALRALVADIDLDDLARSHRHAHWLLPAVHWLERDDLLALTSNLHDEPYVQYGVRAIEPPAAAREEWRIFVDLALAMNVPLFGVKGVNRFVKASRRLARVTRRPTLEFSPHWINRLIIAMSRKVNGHKLKWPELLAHPHGIVLGLREYGHFSDALRTDDKRVHLAPPELVARARELLAAPSPVAPPDYPFQVGNRRHRHSMNSFLNDLPGLHPGGKGSEVLIHPADADELGVNDGDLVRVFSPVGEVEVRACLSNRPRRGLIVIDHGWGSRIFDPRGGSAPQSFGVNRNLLIDSEPVDPLSQSPAMSSSYVAVERVPNDTILSRHPSGPVRHA